MPSRYDWLFGQRIAPNTEQNLLVSPCKHLYFIKDEEMKFQQKPIDPLRAGHKQLLTRLLALDVGTGAFYGEIQIADDVDVLGFLSRAWVKKPDHFMHGVPKILNLPRVVLDNASYMDDIYFLNDLVGGLRLEQVPSGFKAGARQLGLIEETIRSDIGWNDRPPLRLWTAQALSALYSAKAARSAYFTVDAWADVTPLPPSFSHAIDQQYEENGWRSDQWKVVVDGSPARESKST